MSRGNSNGRSKRNGQAVNRLHSVFPPITISGDGRQVRDVLFVEDLIEAFLLARKNISAISGQVFNIGGGPANTTSLLELLKLIGDLQGSAPEVRFDAWRPADQQYYVSNTRQFSEAAGWRRASASAKAWRGCMSGSTKAAPPRPYLRPSPSLNRKTDEASDSTARAMGYSRAGYLS